MNFMGRPSIWMFAPIKARHYHHRGFKRVRQQRRREMEDPELNRRAILLGAVAAAVTQALPRTASADVGSSASPQLLRAIEALPGVTEGSGAALHVMFAPWCHVSPDMYNASRAYLSRLRLHWIPYSGGMPEGKEGTEFLLRAGTADRLPESFVKLKEYKPAGYTPISDAQDAAVKAMLPVYFRDVGHGLASPTLFFSLPGDRVRVFRGEPSAEQLAFIARVAA
jgi:hypothetical protein